MKKINFFNHRKGLSISLKKNFKMVHFLTYRKIFSLVDERNLNGSFSDLQKKTLVDKKTWNSSVSQVLEKDFLWLTKKNWFSFFLIERRLSLVDKKIEIVQFLTHRKTLSVILKQRDCLLFGRNWTISSFLFNQKKSFSIRKLEMVQILIHRKTAVFGC